MLKQNIITGLTKYIKAFAGTILIVVGMLVIYGWHTSNESLIRFSQALPAMQYNAAISFIFCGISILLIFAGWRLSSVISISIPILISLLTLLQYVSGANLGIDHIFIHNSIYSDAFYPGRISLNGTVNFFLTGAAILSLNKGVPSQRRLFVAGILGTSSIAFAVCALLGYLVQLRGFYSWTYITGIGMPPLSSICFIISGAAITVSAWQDKWRGKAGTPRWLPYAVGISLLNIIVTFWRSVNVELSLMFPHPADDMILVIGITATGLLGMLVYYVQRANINTSNTKSANLSLKLEIAKGKYLEEHLKRAQQLAKMGSWEWDLINNRLLWSENVYNLFGLYELNADISCEAFKNSIYPDDREFVTKSLNEALYQNKPYSIDYRIVLPAGTVRTIHSEAEVSFIEQGNPILMIGTVQDVTETRDMEEMLHKSEEKLLQAQKMEAIGQLTGGIAHDFNNMLTALIGYASLLRMKLPKGDPLLNYAEKISMIIDKSSQLVQGLLTFSRKQEVTFAPVNLNTLIRDTSNILSRLVREDIEFDIKLSNEDLIIMADSGQIIQVLINLVKNSADAVNNKKGSVTLSTKTADLDDNYSKGYGCGKSGRYACISVTDTGIGIKQELLDKIYEPFFTTKAVGEGTGLGLSIVYGIIKGHEACINISSEEGKGTTFNVYFPLVETQKSLAEPDKQSVLVQGTGTVLIAEDNQDIQYVTKTVLEEAGFNIIIAKDGEDAVQKFIDNIDMIELVILDVIMPKKNGIEVYKEIRELSEDIKTIFISGHSEDIINNEQLPEKDLVLVQKPLNPSDLARKVKEVMEG